MMVFQAYNWFKISSNIMILTCWSFLLSPTGGKLLRLLFLKLAKVRCSGIKTVLLTKFESKFKKKSWFWAQKIIFNGENRQMLAQKAKVLIFFRFSNMLDDINFVLIVAHMSSREVTGVLNWFFWNIKVPADSLRDAWTQMSTPDVSELKQLTNFSAGSHSTRMFW